MRIPSASLLSTAAAAHHASPSALGEAYTLELHEPPPTGGNRRWLSIDPEGNVLLSHTVRPRPCVFFSVTRSRGRRDSSGLTLRVRVCCSQKCRWVVHRYSTTWAQKVGSLYSKLGSLYGPGISAELRLGVFVS